MTSRLQFNLLDAYTGLGFSYQVISYKSELQLKCKIENLTSGLLHRACLWLTAAATREEIQASMYRGRRRTNTASRTQIIEKKSFGGLGVGT